MTDNVLEPRDGPPLPPNGEVEGPDDHARSAPRAHTAFRRLRRRTTHASRRPRTIVRGLHFGRSTMLTRIPAGGPLKRQDGPSPIFSTETTNVRLPSPT